ERTLRLLAHVDRVDTPVMDPVGIEEADGSLRVRHEILNGLAEELERHGHVVVVDVPDLRHARDVRSAIRAARREDRLRGALHRRLGGIGNHAVPPAMRRPAPGPGVWSNTSATWRRSRYIGC